MAVKKKKKKKENDRAGRGFASFFYSAGALFLLFLLLILFDLAARYDLLGKSAGFIPFVYFTSVFQCFVFCSMAIFFLIDQKKNARSSANRFIYIWAAGVTGIIISEFLPSVYIGLRVQSTELITARQMGDNAVFLVLDAVLLLSCVGSYLIAKKDFFIWLGLIDFAVCGACALLLPLPPVDITNIERVTSGDILYSALYYIVYLILSVNLFVVGVVCHRNPPKIINEV